MRKGGRRSSWVIFVAVVALSSSAAGVGLGAGSTTVAAPERSRATEPATRARDAVRATVRLVEYRLIPSRLRIRRGGTVEFRAMNRGTIVHALAVRTRRGTARTRNIKPRRSAVLKVRLQRGSYRWWCPTAGHRQLGMRGKITVG